MEKPKIKDVSKALGISMGMAGNIMAAPWTPDASKFRTLDKFLTRLCQAATRHGHKSPELLRYQSEHHAARTPERPPAPETEATEEKPASDSPPAAAMPPDPPPNGNDQSLRAIEDGLKVCVATMRAIGKAMLTDLRAGDTAGAALASRDFIKVMAELRQTATKCEELKKARAELMPRDEVLSTCSGLWLTFRAFGDQLIGQLVNPGCLPAWIAETGGTWPENREAKALVQERIRVLVEARFNELADAMAGAGRPVNADADTVALWRGEMVAELKRITENMSK